MVRIAHEPYHAFFTSATVLRFKFRGILKGITTEYSPSSALPSSGKAPSSGQNPASQPFLFSKSPQ